MSNGYEQQLSQIQQALTACDNEEDRANLISLESDLKELISLENFESKNSESESDTEVDESYAAERKSLYQHLINEKCRAPFKLNGQAESYHNAFIADIMADIVSEDDEDGVTVKVLFLNPTNDRMKACNYFFSNRCTFENNCKYSHGEIVKYSRLKHYQNPNFKSLKRKSHVLVKADGLWKPGSIVECSHDLKSCQVKLHNSGKVFDCPFSDVLPPIDDNSDSSDLSTDDEQSENESDFPSRNVLQIDDNFGEWEKHTTGIGSKILQKFGYVNGSGLGKRGDGITEPISAKIYVQGKSLDYNMELNERRNRETVEESSRKQSLKHQKASEKAYSTNQNEVFNFLNNTILNSFATKPAATSTVTSKTIQAESVKSQSKTQLNINHFKLEEDIKKVESSLNKLKQSLTRHSTESIAFKNINSQVVDQERSLSNLQRTLLDVNKEQQNRREKSKLTIF